MSWFLKFPRLFYIEPTNNCNLGCIICPQKKQSRQKGYISFDLFSEIVNQLSRQEIDVLTLHQIGEPLLHPRICEMVRYVKKKGIKQVRFATNATLLDEAVSKDLIDSRLDSITISMDASTTSLYNPDLANREIFQKIDENVLRLLKMREKKGLKMPFVQMQIVDIAASKDIRDNFIKKWQGVVDRVTVKEGLSWAGQVKISKQREHSRFICNNLLRQGVVQWNGDVAFCCLYTGDKNSFDGLLGNAHFDSLESIFLGNKRRRFIEAQLKGDYQTVSLCKDCPDWNDYSSYLAVEISKAKRIPIY